MTEVLEFPPLVDAPAALPAHALTTIAAAAKSVVTIKEAAVSHLRAQEATILALVERYRAVALALDTPKGLAAGQAALTEVRENGRFAVQRARDATKDLLNAAKKDVEIEADRLIALIKPTEDHLEGQVSARKKVLADEKAERERVAAEAARVEAERVARHQAEIAKITAYPRQAQALFRQGGQVSEKIGAAIDFVRGLTFGPEWEEFCDEAANARDEAVAEMVAIRATAQAREEEAARVEAQRVENARVAAELAETQRKLDEKAAALEQRQDDIDRMESKAQERRDAESKPALTTTAPALDNPLDNQAPEPIAEAPAPAPVAEAPSTVVAEVETLALPAEARLTIDGTVYLVGEPAKADVPKTIVGIPAIQIRLADGRIVTITGLSREECAAAAPLFMSPVRLIVEAAHV